MDTSSVQFLNQFDFSHDFLNFPEEIDHLFFSLSDGKNDIFTNSLILLDEDDPRQQERKRAMESDREKALFEYNQKLQAQALIDYYMQHQDNLRTNKRAHSSVFVTDNVGSELPAPASPGSSSSGQHHGRRLWVKGRPKHHRRRLWVKERSKVWWKRCNHPDFPQEEFRRSFRMSKSTFDMICDELNSVLIKKNTTLRKAVPVRQRVAVCIWSLATGDSLRLVSRQFGLGVSTCQKLILEVCSAIRAVLMPKFLHWPIESKMKKIKNEYESISGIPNIGGSLYTTHVPISAPKTNMAEYFNKIQTLRSKKTCYSITVQGVVDPKGIFTDVFIGWPGSMNDYQVLEESALNQRAKMGHLKGVWIVANSGIPLMDWVLVPYNKTQQKNLTWSQDIFNERVLKIQNVAKEAFGRLKGRWRCLQKKRDTKLQDLPSMLGACCVLHNICEMRNEEMDPECKFEVFDDEVIPENNIRSANAVLARDYAAFVLLHHGLA